MESLEVVDVFCTASECATTFTSNFSTISIFIIFHFFCFWIFSFWHAKCWRGVLQDEFLIIFWIKHDHIFSKLILVFLNSKNFSIHIDRLFRPKAALNQQYCQSQRLMFVTKTHLCLYWLVFHDLYTVWWCKNRS